MEVRHQAADVARTVLPAAQRAGAQLAHVRAILVGPGRRVGLVDAVVATLVGHLHVLVGQHEGCRWWGSSGEPVRRSPWYTPAPLDGPYTT